MQIKFLHFFFWLTIFLPCTFARAEQIADRLLMAVGNNSFSQYELEAYLFTKAILLDKGPPKSFGQEWRKSLDEFSRDMTMLSEADRIGGFKVPKEKVDEHLAVCRKYQAESPLAVIRNNVNDAMLRSTIQMVLKVENYRSSRQWQRSSKESPAWFKKLYETAKIRYFDGADKYVAIQ